MAEITSTKELLVLRKLTRAIGDIISSELKEYLATLTPLFNQRSVFGENIEGSGKETPKGADQAFAELKTLYQNIATKPPFTLPRDLRTPLMRMTPTLELSSWEYDYACKTDGETKSIAVTCPFKWVLTYASYTPQRFKEQLADRNRDEASLQQFVLHYLALHVLVTRKPGISRVLETLHFPIGSGRLTAFGALPMTYIQSAISTSLPPDQLVIESTELSGKDAFEELVAVGDIEKLKDPLKERLLDLVASQG